MMSFDRKEGEYSPLLYNIGDKIMGFQISLGGEMLVGGKVIEVEQSKSYLDDNKYNVELEHEIEFETELSFCNRERKDGMKITWWLDEKNAQPFDTEVWKKAVAHWVKHNELKRKSYLEYIRMHKSLRKEKAEVNDISDEELEKELKERYKVHE